MPKKLNVLIVDDHPMFRMAINSILKYQPYIGNIEQAHNGMDALFKLGIYAIDVVLLDVNMPEMDGVACMKEIAVQFPGVKVIILTQFGDARFFSAMVGLGAHGYLLKSESDKDFIKSFESIVFDHKLVVSEEVESSAVEASLPKVKLSQRELDIVVLICQEFTSVQISKILSISHNTVRNHRKRLFKKLGVEHVAGLIKYANDHKLIP